MQHTVTRYWSTMHVPEGVRLAGEWTDATTPKTGRPAYFEFRDWHNGADSWSGYPVKRWTAVVTRGL